MLCDKEKSLISEAIGQIVGLILAHSVLIGSELQQGELLVPVVIYYQDGVRKIETFEAETQSDAVSLSEQFLNSMDSDIEKWAYVRDGLLSLENGEKQDVYFIKAWVKGMNQPLEVYQMYQPSPFKLVDNIKVLNYESSGLNADEANLFISALDDGIFSHPGATSEELQRWF